MHTNKIIFLISIGLFSLILLSGCTDFDPAKIAQTSEQFKTFLADYPNASANVQLLTKEKIEMDADFVDACDGVDAGAYYKVVLTDAETTLRAVGFVSQDQTLMCAFNEYFEEPIEPIDENTLISIDENEIISPNNNRIINSGDDSINITTGLVSSGTGAVEPQLEEAICNSISNVAVRLPGDMLTVTVPISPSIYSNVQTLGGSISFTNNYLLLTDKGQFVSNSPGYLGDLFANCFSNVFGAETKNCAMPISMNIPSNGSVITESGAIILTFEGSALPFCPGCPPGTHSNITSDGTANSNVDPCVANVAGVDSTSNSTVLLADATYDDGSSYRNGLIFINSNSTYPAAITGMNGPTTCMYKNYSPVAIFNQTSCKVQFDHPQACEAKTDQVLCGQCPYTSSEVSKRGQCHYCPSGTTCDWGVKGICGGVQCLNSGSNNGTNSGTYYVSCSQCDYDSISYRGSSYNWCNYYYNQCVLAGCGRILDNCR